MALDELSAILVKEMIAARPKPMFEMSAQEARDHAASLPPRVIPVPDMAKVTDYQLPVTGGTIPVRVFIPSESPRGIIVNYHGGGWVLGSVEASDPLGRRLAERTNCSVVLVGYRLAPEYRFPTAVDDAYAALCWTHRSIKEIAGGPVPIIVAGDSAGGNLAAVVARKSRDQGGPTVAMQILNYPVVDCNFDTDSYNDPENALSLTRESMVWFWDHYAPDPAARTNEDASPLRVGDLSNLPPAVVITAEHDVLRTEGDNYAVRLADAGVPVRHRCFAGQMHGFLGMGLDLLPGSDAAFQYITEAVNEFLSTGEL